MQILKVSTSFWLDGFKVTYLRQFHGLTFTSIEGSHLAVGDVLELLEYVYLYIRWSALNMNEISSIKFPTTSLQFYYDKATNPVHTH